MGSRPKDANVWFFSPWFCSKQLSNAMPTIKNGLNPCLSHKKWLHWLGVKTDAGVVLKVLKPTFNKMSHQITFPFQEKLGKTDIPCKHALQVKKCKLWAAGGRKQVPTLWANNCKSFVVSLLFPDTASDLIPHSAFILSAQLTWLQLKSSPYLCSCSHPQDPFTRRGECF